MVYAPQDDFVPASCGVVSSAWRGFSPARSSAPLIAARRVSGLIVEYVAQVEGILKSTAHKHFKEAPLARASPLRPKRNAPPEVEHCDMMPAASWMRSTWARTRYASCPR